MTWPFIRVFSRDDHFKVDRDIPKRFFAQISSWSLLSGKAEIKLIVQSLIFTPLEQFP